MRLKHYSILMISVLIPVTIGNGCRSGSNKAPGTIDVDEAGELVGRIETMKQVYHLCPSPAEMLSVINVADLQFDAGLLNPVENQDAYLDTRSRTMALGLYITDLAYSALFGRHEETLDYLEVVRSVAEEIHVTGAITEELIEKARNNVGYLDTLFNISNEAFVNMLFFCERNDRPETMIMLSAGAFIESLYLAIQLVDDYDDAGYILTNIADQKYAIVNLITFAESMAAADENVAAVVEELTPLKLIYDGIKTEGSSVQVKSEGDGKGDSPKKIVIGSTEEPAAGLSNEDFEKLKEETIRIRSKIAEG